MALATQKAGSEISIHSFASYRADNNLSQRAYGWGACLRPLAPGLTPRSALDKFAVMQMPGAHFQTTNGREPTHLPALHQAGKRTEDTAGGIEVGLPPQAAPRHTQKGQRIEE